jgi:hypothetical protein
MQADSAHGRPSPEDCAETSSRRTQTTGSRPQKSDQCPRPRLAPRPSLPVHSNQWGRRMKQTSCSSGCRPRGQRREAWRRLSLTRSGISKDASVRSSVCLAFLIPLTPTRAVPVSTTLASRLSTFSAYSMHRHKHKHTQALTLQDRQASLSLSLVTGSPLSSLFASVDSVSRFTLHKHTQMRGGPVSTSL